MAEVRMSLKEYDELKGELNFYKNIVEQLTTVAVDDWALNYYKDHHSFSISSIEIQDPKTIKYIKENILKNLPDEYKNLDRDFSMSTIRLSLGELIRKEEELETTEEGS